MGIEEKVTSRHNTEIMRIKKLLSSAAMRHSEGEFVCEGGKLLQEAVDHNVHIGTVLLREGCAADAVPECDRLLIVPKELLEYTSSQKSPNDILFTCSLPAVGDAYGDGMSLILENVQDPGNVGTVIRTASAFGVHRVILVGECADPFGPKAVRASMGAIFRLKIGFADYEETADFASRHDIYAAALGDCSMDLRDVDLDNAALAIGSEGHGLSDIFLAMCSKRVRIPMTEDCESLNAAAAAAVLMWELCGKNLPK